MRTHKVRPPKHFRRIRIGAKQQKILLLFLSGISLSFARTHGNQWKIIRGTIDSWREIDKWQAEETILRLYESKLLRKIENADGTTTLVLSDDGKRRALTYRINAMKIERSNAWDGKWRIIIFDIPESERESRDALRRHLTYMGFRELQKSVSVFPFDCRKEIEFIIEFHDIRKYVRFIVASEIDNESHLRKLFGLNQPNELSNRYARNESP